MSSVQPRGNGVERRKIVVRREVPADEAAVRLVNEGAFGSSVEADIVEAVRRSGSAALSLVAVREEDVVGHILFSKVELEPRNEDIVVMGLGPMAVLPERQRHGIGSILVLAGLDECRRSGCDAVVLLGHPEYYPRFGFVPAGRLGLRCEYDAPDEAFMAIELKEGVLSGVHALVRYHPAFSESARKRE